MLFIGASFFGCVLAVKEKAHIVVDMLLVKLPPQGLKMANVFISLANIFVQTVLIDASMTWIDVAGTALTPGMRLPSYIFYSFMPITSTLIILYELLAVKENLCGGKGGNDANEHVDPVS